MTLSPHIQTTVPLAAGLLAIVLAGVIWMPLGQKPNLSLPEDSANAEPAGPDADTVITQGAQELLARPLFHMTRRPPEIATVAEPVPVIVTLSLTGIVENDNVQVALMKLSNNPQLFRARVGDKIQNWEISEITPTSVTVITPDGASEVISLTQGN